MKVWKGNFVFTKQQDAFTILENSYIVTENGSIKGVFDCLPEDYKHLPLQDYEDSLIIPGFVDVHLHASQFQNIGVGYDKQLLPWLKAHTFPEEARFADLDYARAVYTAFIQALWEQGTTQSIIFATIHKEATGLLMDLLIESGLAAYVGKVNMDQDAPEALLEDTETSLRETQEWLQEYKDDGLVKPILTPRFVPSCTKPMLEGLGKLAAAYDVPVQSHLSENKGEIELVRALHPERAHYSDVYSHYGLFGQQPTMMAHCVHPTDAELDLMQQMQVFVAHCPMSNANISSGIAPVREFLERKIPVGIGSDIAGGHSLSIRESIVLAIESSKLYALYVDPNKKGLTLPEAFYLATKGGGAFAGKVGSFEKAYRMDALVIDDSRNKGNALTLEDRIQKFIYAGNHTMIKERIVNGNIIPKPVFIQ